MNNLSLKEEKILKSIVVASENDPNLTLSADR